jgi:hypothetical protein
MDGPAAHATLDLTRDDVPTSRWRVTLRPESGEFPRVAGFAFHSVKDGRASPGSAFVRDVRSEDGVFLLDAVPAGRWRVSIRPGSSWHDPAGFFTAPDVEREFAAGAQADDTVPVNPAGRLVVKIAFAPTTLADFLQARVLDASGNQVPLLFANRTPSRLIAAGQPLPGHASDVFPALAPGRYTLEATGWLGGVSTVRTAPFEVVAGRVTRVALDLR